MYFSVLNLISSRDWVACPNLNGSVLTKLYRWRDLSDTFDEKITPPHPLDFDVLEPRIMLDATGALVWSLTDAAALDNVDVIASMSELYEQFEAQFDAETADGILASLPARFDDGLLGGQDLVSIADGQDGTGAQQ